MNLQAIIIANMTGFLLIFFLLFSRVITKTKSTTEEHAFQGMMILTMIACVVETVTYAMDGQGGRFVYWADMIGTTYLYYANVVGAFLWCMFVDLSLFHDYDRIKRIYYPLRVPVAMLLVSLLGNLKGHYYFYLDEQNVYHRQPWIYVFFIYVILCALYSILLYCYHKHKVGRAAFFPMYMYLLPVVVSSALQMWNYGVSLAWLGASIGIVALYMSMQNQRAYLDGLTGLYNRLYLDHTLYIMSRDTTGGYYGIMLDLNFFKSINDTFGHSVGDDALKEAAAILRKASSKLGTVYRLAGDEFIIIVKTEKEEEVIAVEKDIQKQAEAFNKDGKAPYRLAFAMGHDRFDAATDNADTFLKSIDAAMYQDKEKAHQGCS